MGRKKIPPSEIAGLISKSGESETASFPDARAVREEKRLFGDDKRDDRFRSAVHWVTVIAVLAIGLTIVVTFIFRIVLMVLPDRYRWLNDEQLRNYDHFIFSGVVGGVLTQGIQKLSGKPPRRRN